MISTCQQCGNERRIIARGLCSRCYGGLWRTGHLDRYPATTKRGRPPFKQPPPRYTNWHAIADDRRREIDRLRAEAGLLYKTLQEIRRDVHFAHVTEDHPLKWDTLCLDIMRAIDKVTPNGTAGAQEARRLWDETRCRVCGWSLAESADRGCVPGNCSQRPAPKVRADAGYERAELAALREMVEAR